MRDGFSERFTVRKGQERLNTRSWKPVGTLAAAVFRSPQEPRKAWPPIVLKMWQELHSPEQDVSALLTIAGEALQVVRANGFDRVNSYLEWESLPPDPWCALLLRQLRIVREITEHTVRAASHSAYQQLIKNNGIAFESMVRWAGCAKNEDWFHATPAGTVLISALFGWARGGLRLCSSCGKFAVFPQLGFQRKYCDECRALSPGRADRATGLPRRKAELWGRVAARMRRRGFKRMGLNDPKSRKSWRMRALRAIHEADTAEQLAGWEERFAPQGKPGRPRMNIPEGDKRDS